MKLIRIASLNSNSHSLFWLSWSTIKRHLAHDAHQSSEIRCQSSKMLKILTRLHISSLKSVDLLDCTFVRIVIS